ncbi:MAG: hypothetical protein ACPGRC_00075 [Salibacteraceae bacterium]
MKIVQFIFFILLLGACNKSPHIPDNESFKHTQTMELEDLDFYSDSIYTNTQGVIVEH